jgi:hypothetical protein
MTLEPGPCPDFRNRTHTTVEPSLLQLPDGNSFSLEELAQH